MTTTPQENVVDAVSPATGEVGVLQRLARSDFGKALLLVAGVTAGSLALPPKAGAADGIHNDGTVAVLRTTAAQIDANHAQMVMKIRNGLKLPDWVNDQQALRIYDLPKSKKAICLTEIDLEGRSALSGPNCK